MTIVIYGAGAIGGAIGAKLHLAGHDVTLIARGHHLAAMQERGLALRTPEGETVVPVRAVGSPAEANIEAGDMVLMAMKGQDTEGALQALAAAAPPSVGVVCTQNGVDNERMALRRFPNTYAMVVMMPATHLEPGIVASESSPVAGILDAGRYPGGVDERIEALCAALESAGFSARPDPKVMRQKYTKLLMNLGNSIAATAGPGARGGELMARARDEAMACYEAAGIDCMTMEEFRDRRGDLIQVKPVQGVERGGGSSWQSLMRGTGSIEADYLNGEICLLGRLHGIPTPVNHLLQETANRFAREGRKPGSLTVDDLLAQLD